MADELTVESALGELRTMFPGDSEPHVQVYVWFRPPGYRASIYQYAPTLSAAMAQVRSWKAAQEGVSRNAE